MSITPSGNSQRAGRCWRSPRQPATRPMRNCAKSTINSSTRPCSCAPSCSRKPPWPMPTATMNRACWLSGTRRRRSRKLWGKSDPMHCTSLKLLLAAVAALLFTGATGCKQQDAAETLPQPVHTALVEPVAMGNGAKYYANIVPYAQVTRAFQSSGYVQSIRQVKSPGGGMRNIDQGDWVNKGTVLATVQQQDYLDKVQQAKAQLERSQADYDKAKLTFDRVSALYGSQSATKPDFDSAQAQLASAQAAVSGSQAQLSSANVALAYCSLKAPFDGWIVSRNVDVGALVGPATSGFTLADTRSVKAVFGVPDVSMNHV